jgi:hypothetical protein
MEVDIFARAIFQEKFSSAAANLRDCAKSAVVFARARAIVVKNPSAGPAQSGQSRRISWTAPQTPSGKAI